MGMTIKDYAKDRGISYESARKQIKRYAKELNGHTTKDGATYLDEFACEFLDKHRMKRPIVISQSAEETQQVLNGLNEELRQKDAKIIALLEKIDSLKDALIEQKEMQARIEQKDNELEQKTKELDQKTKELEQKDAELNTYHKTIFGLYRKE